MYFDIRAYLEQYVDVRVHQGTNVQHENKG